MQDDPRQLQYAHLAERPGLVTGLGVMSIIFGSLGIMVNGITVLYMVLIGFALAMTNNMGGGTINTGSTPAGVVTAVEAQIIVDALHQTEPMSEADQARLLKAVQMAELPMVPPAEGQPWTVQHVTSQIASSYVEDFSFGSSTRPADESPTSLYFDFGFSGSLYVNPGDITFDAWALSGVDTTTVVYDDGTVESYPTNFGAFNPFGGVSVAAAWAMGIAEGIEVLLAVALLVIGIGTMRDAEWTWKWHRLWAWTRIVVALVAAGASFWMIKSFYDSIFNDPALGTQGGKPGQSFTTGMAGVAAGIGLLLAIGYPIAVLLTTRTISVRNWFRA
ncbi:MAG: hypothetical protein AAGI46_13250 [Planctomycetota bacterium]